MEKETYDSFYKLEGNHWWFVGRRYLVFNFIDKYIKNHKSKKLRILDIGCGTGRTMKDLRKYGKVYGIDYSNQALKFCKKRHFNNVKRGSVEKLPYANKSFDFATCLDVLYHKGVKDDVKALGEINRVLTNDGYLFITDAAMKYLWSKHDVVHHTKRRYTRKELERKLLKSGFKIERITYFNAALFPFIYLARSIGNILNSKPTSDIKKVNKLVNFILKSLYKFELFLVNYINYPFGVSIFVVAQKK